jgi:hypothetical protein
VIVHFVVKPEDSSFSSVLPPFLCENSSAKGNSTSVMVSYEGHEGNTEVHEGCDRYSSFSSVLPPFLCENSYAKGNSTWVMVSHKGHEGNTDIHRGFTALAEKRAWNSQINAS